jgi:hypothetical protein
VLLCPLNLLHLKFEDVRRIRIVGAVAKLPIGGAVAALCWRCGCVGMVAP